MNRNYPAIWVIGATRSCKTALAENGIAPLGYHLISTGTYFRERYGQPDTYSREFVFNLSDFSAACLADNPACHRDHLQALISEKPCVVEGERNPLEFANLYDPKKDMVIILNREDMESYDTVIERGIAAIEQQVRWCVSTGIAPQDSAFKVSFGHKTIRADRFGKNNGPDEMIIQGDVPEKALTGPAEDRYPWINILIGFTREQITYYYRPKTPSGPPPPRP